MYSLIVSGLDGTWDRKVYELEVSRVARDYTVEPIADRYRTLNDRAINELLSFPAIFAYEQGVNADARLGFLKRIQNRSGSVRFEYDFYSHVPPIPLSKLADLRWELDIAKLELHRTHWAIKDVDLIPTLLDAGIISKEQVARLPTQQLTSPSLTSTSRLLVAPNVFTVPTQQDAEFDLVSVMMPFEATFDSVYSTIQLACAEAGMRCQRADNLWQESVIIQDIFNLLVRSRIVIVDFSGKNANVMYETGIAHTLGRDVIPLSQSLNDVPFDLRHHRVLTYLANNEGLSLMRTKLTERLKTLRD